MSTSKSSIPKSRKRAYHHGDLRPALLRTAAEMLEKEGLEALTLRELARRAGVSHNAPYRHFPDRESLLAALAAEGFAALGAAQRDAAKAGGLRGMGEAYVRFALAQPERFRLMFDRRPDFAAHPALREAAERVFEGLSGALAARVPGAQGASDASLAAWALVHGLAQLMLSRSIAPAARAGRGEAAFIGAVLGAARFVASAPAAG